MKAGLVGLGVMGRNLALNLRDKNDVDVTGNQTGDAVAGTT